MKFHFEDQSHQAAAISAVTDLLEGAVVASGTLPGEPPGASGHAKFELRTKELCANLTRVTTREGVEPQAELLVLEENDLLDVARAFPNFSVEMETGTGKTYVYISTALSLAELYGFRKFVILVHSVAIRAGVVKTFQQTASHFQAKYPSLSYRWRVLGEGAAFDDFVEPSNTVQFLIASIQAVDKPATNSVYQEPEQPKLWDIPSTAIGGLSDMRPVVILDEPQNMGTSIRKRAIATLNPLFALRYSATHREPFNLVHRLGAKAASERGLVKKVSVKGVSPGGGSAPYVRLNKITTKNKRLYAEATIDRMEQGVRVRRAVVLQPGTQLLQASNGIEAYGAYVVEEIRRKPDTLVFGNLKALSVGEEIGVDKLALWKDQVRHTIRQHLLRQAEIDAASLDVKVLSLFFVDRVADYVGEAATLPQMFNDLYRSEWVRAGLAEEECPDPADLRTSYFASTKAGVPKDTAGTAVDAEREARAYQEIIANKELLLARSNPRAFVFSHSALREGWDNPNVFQVCFLRHTRSVVERRQQIGRGLRLPVNEHGNRVTEPSICRLTLIVDESFSEFRDGLNKEYASQGAQAQSDQPPAPEDADQEVVVSRRDNLFQGDEFAELWKRIRYRARYRLTLDPSVLPEAVASSELLDEINYLPERANLVETAELLYDDAGNVVTADEAVLEGQGEALATEGQVLPDLIRLLEDRLSSSKFPLQLTRQTLAFILEKLPEELVARCIDQPEGWARIVANAIRTTTIEKLVDAIVYEPADAADWWDAEVIFLATETVSAAQDGADSGVVESSATGKNLFDHTIYDSGVERKFSVSLDADPSQVLLYTKLPRRFRVATPVGEYSPDWAIVYQGNDGLRLHLVRETKSTLNLADLEWDEAMRIRFAKHHFAAAPNGEVSFTHTTDAAGLRI